MTNLTAGRSAIARLILIGLGTAAIFFGGLYPLPSYYDRQAARERYEQKIGEHRQRLADFQDKLKPGEITRKPKQLQLDQLNRTYDRTHNQFAAEVNLAVDAHKRDRRVGWGTALAGITVVILTLKFTTRRTSHLDQMAFEFEG